VVEDFDSSARVLQKSSSGGVIQKQSCKHKTGTPLLRSDYCRHIICGFNDIIFQNHAPFWSPDSRSIAFFADSELKRVEASGGPVQVICPAPEARGGSWSQAGVIVFSPSINGAILRVPASGGTPSPVTQFDASHSENSHRWPYFLPDGKHFLYLARTTALNSSSINVGSLDGTERHVVLSGLGNASYSASGYLVYPSGNDVLARQFDLDKFTLSGDAITIAQNVPTNGNVQHSSYSISRNGVLAYLRSAGAGRSALKWVDRTGKLIRLIDQDSTFFAPSLSPDGKKLVVSVAGEQSLSIADLWIYDLKTLAKTRFTFSSSGGTLRNRLPVWSPDGSRIAFSSFRDGHSQIFVKSTNGPGNTGLSWRRATLSYVLVQRRPLPDYPRRERSEWLWQNHGHSHDRW